MLDHQGSFATATRTRSVKRAFLGGLGAPSPGCDGSVVQC